MTLVRRIGPPSKGHIDMETYFRIIDEVGCALCVRARHGIVTDRDRAVQDPNATDPMVTCLLCQRVLTRRCSV